MTGARPADDTVPINVEITPLPSTQEPSSRPSATQTADPSASASPHPGATASVVPPGRPGAGLPGSGGFGEPGQLLGGVGIVALVAVVVLALRRTGRAN